MFLLHAIRRIGHIGGPERSSVGQTPGIQMTVRALQRVADKLPGVALRIMKDSLAETNRVTELVLWNFVISRRAERRPGIFASVARDRLVRLCDRRFDFRRVEIGQ